MPENLRNKIGKMNLPSLTSDQIKEIYYVVNVMWFVYAFFSLAACVYIKYSLRNRLLFTAN